MAKRNARPVFSVAVDMIESRLVDPEPVILTLNPLRGCGCEDHDGYENWHGTITGYTGHRCDCLDCMMIMREYHATPERRLAQREANTMRAGARRVRETGAEHERYGVLEIARRDNWTCRLCDTRIDAALAWPHPYSFSIDHVIPIARGGDDSPENVQAAHLRCNIRKNDRLESELAS